MFEAPEGELHLVRQIASGKIRATIRKEHPAYDEVVVDALAYAQCVTAAKQALKFYGQSE